MPTRLCCVLAACATLLLVGCTTTGADEQTKASGPDGYVGGTKSLTQVPPESRRTAPVAAGIALGSNRTLSTADYAGKVIVLNVWGSWCAPCRQEAGDLQQASVETAKKAQFIGINSRDVDPAPALAFTRAFKVTYPSIYDSNGKVLLNFAGNLPLSTFPSTLIIDNQGRIAVRISGPITRISLVDLIDDVAAGK
jgi:thiol-disulfide isomerase/thioredoxin